MKKTKTNIPLLIGLIILYIVIWFIQFRNTAVLNPDVIEIQNTATAVQDSLKDIQGQLDALSQNSDLPGPLIGSVKEISGRLNGAIEPLNGVIGPLNGFLRVDSKGITGIISQFSALSTVLLVILCNKPGYIASVVLNGLSSLYTLIFAVILRSNLTALPGVAIPLIGILTNTVIFFYLNRTIKMHAELNESYEQAIENNRIIQEKDEVLSYLAYYDRLTQMPNRQLFMENLGEEYTVIYSNLDNFRQINDTFGHSLGDELLLKFAQRLEGICGDEIFSAKIGGDEYGFILPAGYQQNDVIQFIGKLQGAFGEPIEVKGERFSLTASFGAATFPNDARSSEDIFRCAETAMFAAKTNGKNQLCFYTANRY